MEVESYFDRAMQNEDIFRGIIRDLKQNKARRPGGDIIPADLDTESGLDLIFQKYSDGIRAGKFTITDFRFEGDEAILGFQTIQISGSGAELRYKLKQNFKVQYVAPVFVMKSGPSPSKINSKTY